MNRFEAIVSALGYSLLREHCPRAGEGPDFPHNRTVRFLLDQHAGMPDYLRLPFRVATLLFGASSVVRHGKPFHRLAHPARWRHINAWRSAPLGPCRDVMRFYESFVIFHWHATHSGSRQVPAPRCATLPEVSMGLGEAAR